jgi:hypothetical protein
MEEQKEKDYLKRIRNLYQDLESLAIVGYNESYEEYMKQAKAAFSKSTELSNDQKKAKIKMIDDALNSYEKLKNAIKK